MTIRHLMAHTSGIGYGFTNPIVNRLQRGIQKSEWELPLLHDPGDKWTYSASTRVLGLIVEKITGVELEAWYQERIFRPLGMVDTSWAVAADKQSRVPTTHSRASGTLQEQPADADCFHADASVPRRRRPVFDRPATTACSSACCSTEGAWGRRDC